MENTTKEKILDAAPVSFSDTAMVVFSPLAYPGYDRMTMAVSNLFFGKFDANKKMNDNTRRERRTQP
ncbi:MAG: hypothetical protein MJ102_07250 [Clostridia bacterium]|nr:hypothetical protein [Clostridia bacterium]